LRITNNESAGINTGYGHCPQSQEWDQFRSLASANLKGSTSPVRGTWRKPGDQRGRSGGQFQAAARTGCRPLPTAGSNNDLSGPNRHGACPLASSDTGSTTVATIAAKFNAF
jgi:hypothetical protein